jgi:uncharacterized protein YgbK (DUF1537 family)
MISIVADDLTGAAEIAGIVWRSGRSVEIRDWDHDGRGSSSDALVWNTASRLLAQREAVSRIRHVCGLIRCSGPGAVFKKVDSVLRGHVAAEARAMTIALGLEGCLLVPVNPSRGRALVSGKVLVDGTPLDRTDFRLDPHHPRSSADAVKLLGRAGSAFVSEKIERGALPSRGWRIGDAASLRDIRRWAQRIGPGTLAAGGADFFQAWLANKTDGGRSRWGRVSWPALGRILFVCGSRSSATRGFVADAVRRGWPVCRMPRAVARARGAAVSKALDIWRGRTKATASGQLRDVLTIGSHRGVGSDVLCHRLVQLAAAMIAESCPDTVCVEGGSTAERLLAETGIGGLEVVGEMAPGIVVLRSNPSDGPRWVVKPGSYPWPAESTGLPCGKHPANKGE